MFMSLVDVDGILCRGFSKKKKKKFNGDLFLFFSFLWRFNPRGMKILLVGWDDL